ncbi:SDR family oxidoreductase [Pseudomonas sp. UL073]|uniref:SDR family oxidoreductase n=1 Tax=Zestomonas insulae TaxID=2809017 RepID=A0ABS2IAC7_9GAMM|nr:SDR family oxidoreductase [Pseudomonas insulae]MBM7060084.1 SDR family oxidoreductase [Pseudomonas insulae]
MSKQSEHGTALITGASSGIGATYAKRLARRGYDLLLVARDEQRLAALGSTLSEETGVRVEVLRADLTQEADLQVVEQRLRDDAAISLLINNAGVATNGPLAEANAQQVGTLINLNIVALTRLSSAAAASFGARGRGAIINVASVVALIPEMFNAVYSASKAYVLSLTQTMHHELSAQGVQVQAVLPGITRTEIWERSGIDEANLNPAMIMEVGDMVDAALAGFDQRELITIPSLPNADDWAQFVAARGKLGPNLSHSRPAERYRIAG